MQAGYNFISVYFILSFHIYCAFFYVYLNLLDSFDFQKSVFYGIGTTMTFYIFYLDFHFIHIEPKRDSPTEMLHTSYLILGTLLEVAIYSGLTGEIFARIPSPKTE